MLPRHPLFPILTAVWITLLLFSISVDKAHAAPPIPTQIADINTTHILGETEFGTEFGKAVQFGGVTYIRLNTLTHGWELWRIDDTGTNVTLVENLYPGAGDGALGDPVVVGDFLYFAGSDGDNVDLWRFDGANFAGVDLDPQHSHTVTRLTAAGSNLYFLAGTSDGAGGSLWHVNGITASHVNISLNQAIGENFNYSELVAVGSTLYITSFAGDLDYGYQTALWRIQDTDATKITFNQNGPSNPRDLTAVGNTLYLNASDGVGRSLWQVVGVTPTKIDPGSGSSLTAVGNALYMRGNDGKWWRVVGTTITRFDFFPGASDIYTTVVGDSLYVRASSGGTTGYLWQINGTTPTKINFNGDANLGGYAVIGNRLYFTVDSYSDLEGIQLWQVEGTVATKIDIPPSTLDQYRNWLISAGNHLWIAAEINGRKKYYSYDGLTVTPLNLPFSTSSMPHNFVTVGDVLYFAALTGTDDEFVSTRYDLWRYDGNTVERIDLNLTGSQRVREIIAVGNAVYVSAGGSAHLELWQVIGTTPTKVAFSPAPVVFGRNDRCQ